MPAARIAAVRARVGTRGFSAYVSAAVERQLQRDLLEELLVENEAQAGPIPQEMADWAARAFRAAEALADGRTASDGPGRRHGPDERRHVGASVVTAQSNDALVAVSDLTLIEAWHARTNMPRFRWYVSRLAVLPVTEEITWRAIELLREPGLRGHTYAIDAVVAATALDHPGPRILFTSDADDMARLCATRAHIEAV